MFVGLNFFLSNFGFCLPTDLPVEFAANHAGLRQRARGHREGSAVKEPATRPRIRSCAFLLLLETVTSPSRDPTLSLDGDAPNGAEAVVACSASGAARRAASTSRPSFFVIEESPFRRVSIESVAQRANVARSLVSISTSLDRAALLDAAGRARKCTRNAAQPRSSEERRLTEPQRGPAAGADAREPEGRYLACWWRRHPMDLEARAAMPLEGAPEILGEARRGGPRGRASGRLIEAVRPALPGELRELSDARARRAHPLGARRSSTRASSLLDPERFLVRPPARPTPAGLWSTGRTRCATRSAI